MTVSILIAKKFIDKDFLLENYFSKISANPGLGYASDLLAAAGGSPIL